MLTATILAIGDEIVSGITLDTNTQFLADALLQVGVELEPSHDFPARAVRPGWNLGVSPVVRWVF